MCLSTGAGVGDIDWAENFEQKTWEKVISINLSGSFYMSQAVGKKMIAAGNGGKIICMASQAGIVAIDKHVAYSASKAGIISMVKSLAYEWGKYGIQVNAVSLPQQRHRSLSDIGMWEKCTRKLSKEHLQVVSASLKRLPPHLSSLQQKPQT